jgi:hypothetical protein
MYFCDVLQVVIRRYDLISLVRHNLYAFFCTYVSVRSTRLSQDSAWAGVPMVNSKRLTVNSTVCRNTSGKVSDLFRVFLVFLHQQNRNGTSGTRLGTASVLVS